MDDVAGGGSDAATTGADGADVSPLDGAASAGTRDTGRIGAATGGCAAGRACAVGATPVGTGSPRSATTPAAISAVISAPAPIHGQRPKRAGGAASPAFPAFRSLRMLTGRGTPLSA